MFEKYKGIINLEQILEEEYNYHFDGDLRKLYETDFIELEGNGVDAAFWITYNGERYLFKPLKDASINIWGELLSEAIAKHLGIPCAEYRACNLGTQKGVITKSIVKDNEIMLLGCEIFQRFINDYKYSENKNILKDDNFRELYEIPDNFLELNDYDKKRYIFNYINNLEQAWSIIYELNLLEIEETTIVEHLKKMLIFDLITLQVDRHPNNWAITKAKSYYYPSELFDNATSFGLGYIDMENRMQQFRNEFMNSKYKKDTTELERIIYAASPNFTLSNDNVYDTNRRKKDNHFKVLNDLLYISDKETYDEVLNMFESITEDTIDTLISELEKTNGITMPSNVYFYITTLLNYHLEKSRELIYEYGRKYNYGSTLR